MNYYDFINALEGIAVDKGLRLIMNRAPFKDDRLYLYFIDDSNQSHSKALVWDKKRETPVSMFARLEELAYEFKRRNTEV